MCVCISVFEYAYIMQVLFFSNSCILFFGEQSIFCVYLVINLFCFQAKKMSEKEATSLSVKIMENITQTSLYTYISCYITINLIITMGLSYILADKGEILY